MNHSLECAFQMVQTMGECTCEAASPAALDDRLRYDPTSGDPDFEAAPLSHRLDAIEQAAWSKGFGEGRRSAKAEAASPAALDVERQIIRDLADLSVADSPEFRDPGWEDAVRSLVRRARLTEQEDL